MRIDKFDHPDHGCMWRKCEVEWIEKNINSAVYAEREACAKLCMRLADEDSRNPHTVIACQALEMAIMSRVEKIAPGE